MKKTTSFLKLISLMLILFLFNSCTKIKRVEFQGIKLGINNIEEVKNVIDEGIKENEYKNIDYYDLNDRTKAITGFVFINKDYPEVPFQMLFFDNVIFKIDLIVYPGLIEFMKHELDKKYGKGDEISYTDRGKKVIFSYWWHKQDNLPSIVMLLGTGIYSLSSRSEYWLELLDNKAEDYEGYYINYFDRKIEEEFLKYTNQEE